MAEKLQQQLKELGSKLESPPASKDVLIKLLKQAAACLSELDQLPLKSVVDSMQSFVNAIAKPELLKHQDAEVKLFVAACICEITRITAPEAPYDDDVLKDIFKLIVSTFSGLSDKNSSSFGRRVVILETVARYRSCVMMLDLECDDLINEMFNSLFTVARDDQSENVFTSIQTIMEVVLEESEDIPEDLLLNLLSVLGRNKKDVSASARKLAMNVIEHCAGKLEPGVKEFLISSMSGDRGSLKAQIDYHEVLYDIYQCAPKILTGVVPYLTGELLSDQLDIRLEAVNLVGDLFASRGSLVPEPFQPVFIEFLKRLTDRTVEIRMSVLEHVKICLLADPFRAEAPQMISALCDRLLDYDENVRKQVVSVLSDVVCYALTSIPLDTIKLIADRLRDKSLSVKSYTLGRLADIYRVYCLSHSSNSNEYDWIIGKILRCFYDKDFRSDAIEPILCLSIFPTDFSVKDKVTNWVRIFSGFDKIEVKGLEKILEQKQRLQQEFLKYLSLRQLSQESDTIEVQKKVTFCFRVMSCCFTDPARAEENFQVLDQLKDAEIWKTFASLLDPNTSSSQACSLRDDMLTNVGRNHQLFEFLSSLSLKCSYLFFGKEHIKEILLEADMQKSAGSPELILSCMTILVILARFSPQLLSGIEEELTHLLEDDNEIMKEGALHILAKAGGTIREQLGVSSRSLDLILERICIEGSRRQAKYAVYALASITKDEGLMSLSVLYKRLVDMLKEKSHLPAVLQSLGCIAQTAMPVFETRETEVEEFIRKNILECSETTEAKANECWDDRSELCSLKVFGIKALVKSYLPVKDAHLRSGIDNLVEMLKNVLSFGEISRDIKSSLVDKSHLKLAAAKAVLRLSKHWEHKIPVDVFYLTLRNSEANFPEVKKLLLNKVHQYVKDRVLDPKYACAFVLDIGSEQLDFEEQNKHNLNDIIQMCQQGRARQVSTLGDTNSAPINPEYILPYVVHALSHHSSFPDVDECRDVQLFESFYRQLYLFLSMLVHGDDEGKSDISINKHRESISLVYSIFLAIKKSEDAFSAAKSKNSYALSDLGLSIIKRLAPKQDDLRDLSASVVLPSALYKPLEKKEGTDSLVGEGKTWLADESILAHFDSLKLEANGIVNSEVVEDETMKDSETEGSEMPLGKLMKRLKAKASKARKEVVNKSAPREADNETKLDILKVVKEINLDNLGVTSKLDSSNGNEYVRKKRSDHKPQKRKITLGESTNVSVPKRRRSSSAQGHKSLSTIAPKGSVTPTNLYRENLLVDSTKIDKELQTGSGDKSMQENNNKPAKSDLLVSSIKKKTSSSRQKVKHLDGVRDAQEDRSNTDAKKSKKIGSTVTSSPISNSKIGSTKNKKQKSVAGLTKCTAKDNESSVGDLIGCRIKVWWPMDKQFYEGVVKSFDTQKKKHVILYDDGDVEVLRLDKERWELVDNGQTTEKQSVSSKSLDRKTGSSERKKNSAGGSKQKKKLADISPSSQVKRKRTPRENLKPRKKGLLSESAVGRVSSPGIALAESASKSIVDSSDSEQEQNERNKKSLADVVRSDNDKKKMEDAEKASSDAEDSKDEETHSEGIEGSDSGGSSSDKKQERETREERGLDAEDVDSMDSHPVASSKPKKKISPASSMDAEYIDDEPLSMWKQRVGK